MSTELATYTIARRRQRLPIVVFTLALMLAGLGIVFVREALEPDAGDALESP